MPPSGFDCWVCGASTGAEPGVAVIVRWLSDHEHSRVEREAARIVKLAERRLTSWS